MGPELGRGGEGSVYEVDGEPTLVAKVYHKTPLPDDHVAKLEAMVSCWTSALEAISAWPRSLRGSRCRPRTGRSAGST